MAKCAFKFPFFFPLLRVFRPLLTSLQFFIKDAKSSSGTFLNYKRLSAPDTESSSFPINDGDVIQLGVDYQGGAEEFYRCIKIQVEIGRESGKPT